MKKRMFVVVAGLQPEILWQLAGLFEETRNEDLIPLRRLRCPHGYTEEYVARLYERVAHELKERLPSDRETLLRNASLTLLYADRVGASEHAIFGKFGVEALIAPLRVPGVVRMHTKNERESVANVLFKEIERALRKVRAIFSVISEEITNRDNRTCLLLPPKSFGHGFWEVCEQVHAAVRSGEGADDFRIRIETLSNSLPVREGKYFVGHNGLVFKCPAKAAARHALAPLWEEGSHNASCVIRGRLRFGVPFDPRFHYDCEVSKRKNRNFPGCHEPQTVEQKRQHINVAPNDNVR